MKYNTCSFWIEDNYLNISIDDVIYKKSLQDIISSKINFKSIDFFNGMISNHYQDKSLML